MSTAVFLVLLLLGAFLFSFILWRKLKEDWPHEHIFTFTLFTLLGGTLGWWVSSLFFPGLLFWATFFAGSAFALWALKRFGLRFFEVADSIVPAWFWLSLFIFLGRSFGSRLFLFEAGASLVSIFIYNFFLSRYRAFSWYPSGKVGFAGLAGLSLYFLLRASIEILAYLMLSFTLNLFDLGVNISLALVLTVVVYLRSGRERAERVVSWRKS